MWWNKKKESLDEKILRILKESFEKQKITIDKVVGRLMRETGINENEAHVITEEAFSKVVSKREELIKKAFSNILSFPFTKTHRDIIENGILSLSNNKIESSDLDESIFNIRLLESENWLIKGEKLVKENKLNEALDSFDNSLKFSQSNMSCLIERGKVLQDLDFHKDAIKDFTKVIDNNPNDFSVIFLRGCSYMKIWELRSAEDDFNKAIRLSVNANEQQTRAAKESGYDSVGSMYRRTLAMLSIFKDDDTEFIEQMKMRNNKQRIV